MITRPSPRTVTSCWSGDVAHQFFVQVLGQAERADLLSKEHFSHNGTMIEALDSQKSYRPKDEDATPRPVDTTVGWTGREAPLSGGGHPGDAGDQHG
ncbi:MAG: hypothetical protein AB2806_12490 [Candidatus Thiodiazotropha sp.]